MINQTVAHFEDMAKGLGLSIKIPRPGLAARSVCSATNSFVGIGLIGTGAILKKPSLIALGALGIVGAALLLFDE